MIKFPTVFSCVATFVFMSYLLLKVLGIESSTGAVWLLILPKVIFLSFLASYTVGWALSHVFLLFGDSRSNRRPVQQRWSTYAAFTVLIVSVAGVILYGFEQYIESVAASSNTTQSELWDIYESDLAHYDDYIFLALAKNKSSPPALLKSLSEKRDPNQKNRLTSVRSLMDGDFRTLAERIAFNPNTPPEILEKLSNSRSWYVRKSVASNVNTPSVALSLLGRSEDQYIRQAVAENVGSDVETIRILAQDKVWHVRAGVIKNQKVPEDVLRNLNNDENEHVRNDAKIAYEKCCLTVQ